MRRRCMTLHLKIKIKIAGRDSSIAQYIAVLRLLRFNIRTVASQTKILHFCNFTAFMLLCTGFNHFNDLKWNGKQFC